MCDFIPVRRTMPGKNSVCLVTFKTYRAKCLVEFLISLGYFHSVKMSKNSVASFAWHIYHCRGPPPRPATDNWLSSLETCLNLFTCSLAPSLVLTPSGGHRNTYGWQASGTLPTGMLSCYQSVLVYGGCIMIIMQDKIVYLILSAF